MIRSPYLRDAVYRWQQTRGFGRITMTALHVDEEWFCREAWRADRRAHDAARRRPRACDPPGGASAAQATFPVVVNLPGAPHARYTSDLREADALVADGWAAEHLPSLLGTAVERVPKGVDAEHFSPTGPNMRVQLGLGDRARRARRWPPRADQEPPLAGRSDARCPSPCALGHRPHRRGRSRGGDAEAAGRRDLASPMP